MPDRALSGTAAVILVDEPTLHGEKSLTFLAATTESIRYGFSAKVENVVP